MWAMTCYFFEITFHLRFALSHMVLRPLASNSISIYYDNGYGGWIALIGKASTHFDNYWYFVPAYFFQPLPAIITLAKVQKIPILTIGYSEKICFALGCIVRLIWMFNAYFTSFWMHLCLILYICWWCSSFGSFGLAAECFLFVKLVFGSFLP